MSCTGAASPPPVHPAYDGPEDAFEGRCPVCGVPGRYRRERVSISESYKCASCGGALRYQSQARAVLWAFSRHGARSLAELVHQPDFRARRIFEPGTRGPFRGLFRGLEGYVQSFYEPTVPRGEVRDGVRCEDLMDLTFPSGTFDLVLTSDIFEHVREPNRAFAELFRVLRPGGWHLFTIPGRWPLPDHTVARVDVSRDEEVLLLPAVYPIANTSCTTISGSTCSTRWTRSASSRTRCCSHRRVRRPPLR